MLRFLTQACIFFYGLGAIYVVVEFCAARAGAVCVWLFCADFYAVKLPK